MGCSPRMCITCTLTYIPYMINTHRVVEEIATQSESPVTSIASDPESTSTFIASFGDGSIKLFDRRLDEEESVVRVFREHSTWIRGARWQRGASKDLVSARCDGESCLPFACLTISQLGRGGKTLGYAEGQILNCALDGTPRRHICI